MREPVLSSALTASILFFSLLSVLPARATDPIVPVATRTLPRQIDTVTVPGTVLNSFQGKRIETVRLYACTEQQWIPIPFQIDEFTEQGERVLTEGPEADPEERNHLIDPQDRLVFH